VIPSFEDFLPQQSVFLPGGGLPIMSSEHGDLSTLLTEYRAGYHFEMSDPAALARRIVELAELRSRGVRAG